MIYKINTLLACRKSHCLYHTESYMKVPCRADFTVISVISCNYMILIIFCKAIGHLCLPRRVYALSGLKVMWAFFGVIQHFDPTQRVLTLPEVFARKFASIVVLFEVVGVLAPEPRAVFESL